MNDLTNPYQAPEAALTDAPSEDLPIEMVSGWRRFLHYLIDVVVMQVLKFAIAFPLVMILGPRSALVANPLLGFAFGLSVWIAYYIVMEGRFQRTVGKFATGTIVVSEDGGVPTFSQILGRSFSRLVPFEGLTCIGDPSRGWHDKWSRTYVVRNRKA